MALPSRGFLPGSAPPSCLRFIPVGLLVLDPFPWGSYLFFFCRNHLHSPVFCRSSVGRKGRSRPPSLPSPYFGKSPLFCFHRQSCPHRVKCPTFTWGPESRCQEPFYGPFWFFFGPCSLLLRPLSFGFVQFPPPWEELFLLLSFSFLHISRNISLSFGSKMMSFFCSASPVACSNHHRFLTSPNKRSFLENITVLAFCVPLYLPTRCHHSLVPTLFFNILPHISFLIFMGIASLVLLFFFFLTLSSQPSLASPPPAP